MSAITLEEVIKVITEVPDDMFHYTDKYLKQEIIKRLKAAFETKEVDIELTGDRI